jgi:hypothetical protein
MPEKVEVGRRLKAEAVWVDWEDKLRFKSIMLNIEAITEKPQTQETAFKAILDFFMKNGGAKNVTGSR